MITSKLDVTGKNILIIGNWSYKNMGDELILIGTIKLLQSQGKHIFVQAYDKDRLKSFLKQFVDVESITFLTEIPKGPKSIWAYLRNGRRKELWSYRNIDSVIIGGGEILTEENPNAYRYRLISLLPILIKKIFAKCTIYLMGGIQIPKKNLNLKLFKFLLKQTSHIYARDFDTVQELKNFGYSQCEFFMDTAYFAWDWKNIIPANNASQPYILVNLNKNGEKFKDTLVQDIISYANKGFKICYVAISKGKNKEYNDAYYGQILQKELAHHGISLDYLDWESDFGSFLSLVKGAEIVISTRLHLFLIASFLGAKTKVYPYQRKIIKMQEVLKSIDL